MVTLLVPNVYYNPDAQFNLISCSQLEDLGYDVHFRQRKIDGNNVEIPITRTGSIMKFTHYNTQANLDMTMHAISMNLLQLSAE